MALNKFFLEPVYYTVPNALCWGNFKNHAKAIQKATWNGRVIHCITCLLQIIPVLGQILSLLEMAIFINFYKRENEVENVKKFELPRKVETSKEIEYEHNETPPPEADTPEADTPKFGINKKDSSDLSDVLTTDSDEPISIFMTAELQMEKARLEKGEK